MIAATSYSLDCPIAPQAAWVERQLYEEPHRLKHARWMAFGAFCAHMDPQDNPNGFVDALLRSA